MVGGAAPGTGAVALAAGAGAPGAAGGAGEGTDCCAGGGVAGGLGRFSFSHASQIMRMEKLKMTRRMSLWVSMVRGPGRIRPGARDRSGTADAW